MRQQLLFIALLSGAAMAGCVNLGQTEQSQQGDVCIEQCEPIASARPPPPIATLNSTFAGYGCEQTLLWFTVDEEHALGFLREFYEETGSLVPTHMHVELDLRLCDRIELANQSYADVGLVSVRVVAMIKDHEPRWAFNRAIVGYWASDGNLGKELRARGYSAESADVSVSVEDNVFDGDKQTWRVTGSTWNLATTFDRAFRNVRALEPLHGFTQPQDPVPFIERAEVAEYSGPVTHPVIQPWNGVVSVEAQGDFVLTRIAQKDGDIPMYVLYFARSLEFTQSIVGSWEADQGA